MKDIEAINYNILPAPLVRAIKEIYLPYGYQFTLLPYIENESEEYGACRFELNGKKIIYRVAKTTPKKVGQFVTCWKRETPKSPIVPFEITDIDYLIISISDENRLGQLILNKDALIKQGIINYQHNKGKLSFRVYGPWIKLTISSAIKAQRWQTRYYMDVNSDNKPIEEITALMTQF